MYDELVKELRDSAEWADRLALLMGRAEGDAHAPVMRKAADAIEELSADCDMYRKGMTDEHNRAAKLAWDKEHCWIPVTERLPDNRRDVQITAFWHDAWRTMYGYYDGAYWHLYAPMHTEVADVYVIGWMEKPTPMPLPQPPEEE